MESPLFMAELVNPLYPSFGASKIGIATNKKGVLTFVVNQDDFSEVMASTGHADRLTGVSSIKSFKKNYREMYDDDFPSVTLTHWSGGDYYSGVFGIKSFRKKGNKYHIKSDSLLSDHSDGLMAHDPSLVGMAELFDDGFAATEVIQKGSFVLEGTNEVDQEDFCSWFSNITQNGDSVTC